MSIPTQIGVNGQGSPIYRFDAIPNTANVGPSLNAADYAQPNDAGDFSAAVTRALTAAGNGGGGRVILPPYPVTFQNPAIGNADNLELIGFGWNSQIVAGSSFPSGSPLLQIQAPGGGVFRYGIRIAHLFLNGNNQAGVNGLDLETTYHALVEHVRVRYCPGTGITLGGSSGNLGAYNELRKCVITDGGAGTGVSCAFSEDNALIDCAIFWYNSTGGVGVKLATGVNQIIGCRFDECQQAVWVSSANANQIIGNQFTRGYLRHIYLNGGAHNIIQGNYFDSCAAGGSPPIIRVDGSANGSNVITGNTVNTGTGWGQFVQENGTMGTVPNLYTNNDTGGLPFTLVTPANGGGIARGNRGYNPVGTGVSGGQPAVPASGTALTNPTGVDCTVFLSGGTFTAAHQIGGASIGNSTATVLRVPAGQTVTLTYSAAPTWVWVGD